MAIKRLQNNYTTPEQSKRLLELGVPADSADCYIFIGYDSDFRPMILEKLYSVRMGTLLLTSPEEYLPCWSAGRLMEIFEICDNMTEEIRNNMCSIPSIKRMPYMEYMIKCFTKATEMKILDFSKLEED